MLSFFSRVQNGTVNPLRIGRTEATKQVFSLELSKFSDVERVHRSGVNSLDIEEIEGRYLLSGGGSGNVCIHDLENLEGKPEYTCKLVGKVEKKYSHYYSVEKVQWYPLDTGLFTTSGMDSKLKIWDTNVLHPIDTIVQNVKIYSHQISPKKTQMVAVALARSVVSLVDLRSGAQSHCLMGHDDKVVSVCWSPTADTLLATGGADNKLLLWDIRCAKGYLYALDRHNTNSEIRKIRQSKATAHNGTINSLKFTPDGLHLISFGTDNRVRLWDVALHCNTLVNYGKIDNDSQKHLTMALCSDSDPQVLFVPSGGHIYAFHLFEGTKVDSLLGHFHSVNCCIFRPFSQELYSGGNDRNILIWVPYAEQIAAYEEYLSEKGENKQNTLTPCAMLNSWSDDSN